MHDVGDLKLLPTTGMHLQIGGENTEIIDRNHFIKGQYWQT